MLDFPHDPGSDTQKQENHPFHSKHQQWGNRNFSPVLLGFPKSFNATVVDKKEGANQNDNQDDKDSGPPTRSQPARPEKDRFPRRRSVSTHPGNFSR